MYFFKSVLLIFTFISISNISYTEVVLLKENTNNNASDVSNNNNNNNKNGNNNQNKSKEKTTSITFDPNKIKNNNSVIVKKVNAITYFVFGTEGKPIINIYISPACLHCAQFLAEDLQKFLNEHKSKCLIKVILIPALARDFFVMKIIQAKAKDLNDYYGIFSRYMKRAIATIEGIHPTKEQKTLYMGSNTDPDMIRYQVIAKEFGFTDEEIIKAIPNMNEDYELAVMEYYKITLQEILNTLKLDNSKQQEIDVPLIICNGKTYKTINDAFNLCNKNV